VGEGHGLRRDSATGFDAVNKLPADKVAEVYSMLAGGVTILQVSKLAGVAKETVLRYATALGDISENWYGGNVEEALWDVDRDAADLWHSSTPEVTIAGFKFRPITEDTLADARRFAIAKAKQAKRPDSLRFLVALRVCFYVFCGDGSGPTPAMRVGLETEPIQPSTLCGNLVEQAEDFELL
jgi:hypothetical protein